MNIKLTAIILSLFILFAFTRGSENRKLQKPNAAAIGSDPAKGLKDYYKKYFPVGVAVAPNNLKTDEAPFILQQFNSLTPENAMKMGPNHPEENHYYWKDADSIVTFAQQHGLKIRAILYAGIIKHHAGCS